MLIKGKVERFDCEQLSGWLALVGEDRTKPLLEVVLDGRVIKVAAADGYRADLEQAGWADGQCYFEFKFDPPLILPEARRLKLRIGGSDLCLELPRDGLDDPDAGKTPNPEGLKVFIVGSPRSGTSVLLRAIQSQFGLPARGESHVIPALAKAIHELRLYYERFKDSPEDILIHDLPLSEFERALFDRIRQFYGDQFGDRGWVDKTPSDEAVYSAGLIRRVFPDARIIVTNRNGIEVVESYRRKFNASFEDAARNWASVMRGVEKLTAANPDILVVDQFDFTNNAGAAGGRIAEYLGRPELGGEVAAFLQSNREDKLSGHDWSRRVTLDDVDWSEKDCATFVEICGTQMEQAGFALTGPAQPKSKTRKSQPKQTSAT